MQLIVHAPFGGRTTRAWGLALRKRFCRTFDFELQAAATDDGIVLSLGEQHSFPLDTVFVMVRAAMLEQDLLQGVFAAPMFGTRWRWNATRALTLPRHAGGRRVPMPIQRMRAEDLLAGGIRALAPAAITAVCAQAWSDVRDAEELHDVRLSLVLLPTRPLRPPEPDLQANAAPLAAHWDDAAAKVSAWAPYAVRTVRSGLLRANGSIISKKTTLSRSL